MEASRQVLAKTGESGASYIDTAAISWCIYNHNPWHQRSFAPTCRVIQQQTWMMGNFEYSLDPDFLRHWVNDFPVSVQSFADFVVTLGENISTVTWKARGD